MCYQVEKDCKNQLVKPKSFLLTTLKNNGLAASKSNNTHTVCNKSRYEISHAGRRMI